MPIHMQMHIQRQHQQQQQHNSRMALRHYSIAASGKSAFAILADPVTQNTIETTISLTAFQYKKSRKQAVAVDVPKTKNIRVQHEPTTFVQRMLRNKKLRTAQLQGNKRKIDDSECAPLTIHKKQKTSGDQATSTILNRSTVALWEMAADGNPVNTETSFKERLKNEKRK